MGTRSGWFARTSMTEWSDARATFGEGVGMRDVIGVRELRFQLQPTVLCRQNNLGIYE
jgi:hypothetical protein